MENCCTTSKSKSMKLLILGIVIILLEVYTQWDLWLVIGVLLIIQAIWITLMPAFAYRRSRSSSSRSKRRR